jgi:hypothetical protein
MVEQEPEGMQEYLKHTELCDCNNRELKERALSIVKGARTPTEVSLRVFRFVRDAIPFNATLDIYQKASETLERRVVDYCCKINVHVALLRAVGVPARCHFARVRKEVLQAFIPSLIFSRLPDPVGHFWCECHVTERWTACEALFDKALYRGLLGADVFSREQVPTIEWDGRSDLVLLKPWIVRDMGIYSSYDDLARLAQEEGMPPKAICKLLDWLPAFFSSRRTDKLRGAEPKHGSEPVG